MWPHTVEGWIVFALTLCTLRQGFVVWREMTRYHTTDDISPFTRDEYERITSPRGWTRKDEREYQAYLDDVRREGSKIVLPTRELLAHICGEADAIADERNQFADDMLRLMHDPVNGGWMPLTTEPGATTRASFGLFGREVTWDTQKVVR